MANPHTRHESDQSSWLQQNTERTRASPESINLPVARTAFLSGWRARAKFTTPFLRTKATAEKRRRCLPPAITTRSSSDNTVGFPARTGHRWFGAKAGRGSWEFAGSPSSQARKRCGPGWRPGVLVPARFGEECLLRKNLERARPRNLRSRRAAPGCGRWKTDWSGRMLPDPADPVWKEGGRQSWWLGEFLILAVSMTSSRGCVAFG